MPSPIPIPPNTPRDEADSERAGGQTTRGEGQRATPPSVTPGATLRPGPRVAELGDVEGDDVPVVGAARAELLAALDSGEAERVGVPDEHGVMYPDAPALFRGVFWQRVDGEWSPVAPGPKRDALAEALDKLRAARELDHWTVGAEKGWKWDEAAGGWRSEDGQHFIHAIEDPE